jgi:hypothetical protein
MKTVVSIILLICLIPLARAQARYLKQDDPMVGNWKFNPDSTKHTQKPIIVNGEDFLELLPGLEVGMMAKFNPMNRTNERASYFTLKKDAMTHKLYFSIIESYYAKWAGKDVVVGYEYHKASDMLVIILAGKRYYYSHVK